MNIIVSRFDKACILSISVYMYIVLHRIIFTPIAPALTFIVMATFGLVFRKLVLAVHVLYSGHVIVN